ncbi:MAG TPA: long-chain fatty acid--CoA ligase [Ktedonobacterales bacterium]
MSSANTDIPPLPETLADLARYNRERFGEYISLVYEFPGSECEYTNLEVDREANKLAHALMGLGVKKGDRVMVMMQNNPQVLIGYQALARIGAITIPVLPLLKPPEVAYIAANSQAVAILTSTWVLHIVQEGVKEATSMRHVIVVGQQGDAPASDGADYQVHGYDALVANQPDTLPAVEIKPEERAVILYTSGTTGRPKGVLLSHRNLISNAIAGAGDDTEITRGRASLAVLPLAHAFGITVSNVAYLSGTKTVMVARFELEQVFQLIEKHRVAGFAGVPAMFVAMLNFSDAEKYDTSSLEFVVSGSAPLPVSVLEGFEKRFNCPIREGYGLSEATTAVSGHAVDMVRKPGSVGKPLQGVEVRVVDDNDNDLPVGEVGELLVRGPNLMQEYYNMPDETAQALRGGWLHTGDMAKLDEEGYIYIVERKKDLIIRGGLNIYPRDVEEVLMRHPAVLECAVIGVPSERLGEEVLAYVVLQDGKQATAEEVMDFSRQYLANYKTPSFVEFIPALPRNPIGKIDRKILRAKSR